MKTLLLSSTYEPMKFISERKAINHVLNDKVDKISAWNSGFKYNNGYCIVCGSNLKFYTKTSDVIYQNSTYKFCGEDCSEYFQIEPLGYLMPAILRLKKYTPRHIKKRRCSRGAIFKRDKNLCQYCGDKFKSSVLTIDHVLPKTLGGKTSWINCVACCSYCNNKKADKKLDIADMKLLNKPTKPTTAVWYDYNSIINKHEDWKHYIKS